MEKQSPSLKAWLINEFVYKASLSQAQMWDLPTWGYEQQRPVTHQMFEYMRQCSFTGNGARARARSLKQHTKPHSDTKTVSRYTGSDHGPAKNPVLNNKRLGAEMEILFIIPRGSKINIWNWLCAQCLDLLLPYWCEERGGNKKKKHTHSALSVCSCSLPPLSFCLTLKHNQRKTFLYRLHQVAYWTVYKDRKWVTPCVCISFISCASLQTTEDVTRQSYRWHKSEWRSNVLKI